MLVTTYGWATPVETDIPENMLNLTPKAQNSGILPFTKSESTIFQLQSTTSSIKPTTK